jgi:hypothetical protein
MTDTAGSVIPDTSSTMLIVRNGTREWRLDGRLHRADDPAIEDPDGNRFDGPAVEWSGGSREWYHNGRRHQPDVEDESASQAWYLVGIELTEDEHAAFRALPIPAQEVTLVLLADGMRPRPAIDTAARCVLTRPSVIQGSL